MTGALAALGSGAAGLASEMLDLILGMVGAVNQLLIKLISLAGPLLQGSLVLKLSAGGPGVFAVWSVIRDICNIAFLAIMVLIAFGTIFNAAYKNPFHYSSSLFRLIIAAVLINFSLAFGQLIIGLGNSGTDVVLGLLGPQDIGAQIATSVQLTSVVAGTFNAPLSPAANAAVSRTAASVNPASLSQLNQSQLNIVQSWLSGAKSGSTAPSLALTSLKSCLENKILPTVKDCMDQSSRLFNNQVTQNADAAINAQNRTIASPAEIIDYWTTYVKSGTAAFTQPLTQRSDSDPTSRLGPLISSLVTFFMLLVLGLSFVVIIVFLIFRIPYLWGLLAVSAGAFLALAWPYGGNSVFTKWWKQVLGWSIFGPLYLFNIYIGLYVLSKQGPLLASLGQGDQSALLPFWAMVGPIMFFAIGCTIFTMGAAWSMRVAFSFSPAAQQLFGKIGGAFGVTEKTGFGIQTISRRLGIEQNVQAARERIAQTGGDITAGLRGRYPGLFSSQEEALAAARQRMGVRAGLGDMEKLSASRVSTERSNIEAYLKRQQAAAAAQGRTFDDMPYLVQQMNSGNRDVSLAAREILTSRGKLDAREMKNTAEQYARVSPVARQSYLERVAKQLEEKASKKEFGDTSEVLSSLDLLSPKQKGKFLSTLERNQPLIAGELAGAGLYLDASGARRTAANIVETNFGALDNSAVLKLIDKKLADPSWNSPDVERLIGNRMVKYDQYLNLINTASPAQRAELMRIKTLRTAPRP